MECYYCDKIRTSEPRYAASPASHDLGSAAPRCAKHWRYVCGRCSAAAHFIATAYCPDSEQFFCSACATDKKEVTGAFWAWDSYFRYRSPWSGEWVPALDRLEFEGRHPLQHAASRRSAEAAISHEAWLVRYPYRPPQWRVQQEFTDDDVRSNWNVNAERWNAAYDDNGDRNRRYQSDEPMLDFLGDVSGREIIDVGSGNGYLCRKLARAGAIMTGVELSDEFVHIARERESEAPLGVTYHHGSVSEMKFLADSAFDKAVSNYVLMDVRDYEEAVREVFRVLSPGGCFVAVISHPCFGGPFAGWWRPAPDSPRLEDRYGWLVDNYFDSGPTLGQWGDFDPVLSFHRPLRDYWRTFNRTGFIVDDFEEPSITDRGRAELPPSRVRQSLRIPYSCIFRLVKPEHRP